MWRYHTIYTIKQYGSLNRLTTETYETLHKNWVKNPYRMSNKKNVLDQMLKTVSYNKFQPHFTIFLFNFLILDTTTNNYKYSYEKNYKFKTKLYEIITLGISDW